MKRNVNIPHLAPDVSIINKRVVKKMLRNTNPNSLDIESKRYNRASSYGNQNTNLYYSPHGCRHGYTAGKGALDVEYQPNRYQDDVMGDNYGMEEIDNFSPNMKQLGVTSLNNKVAGQNSTNHTPLTEVEASKNSSNINNGNNNAKNTAPPPSKENGKPSPRKKLILWFLTLVAIIGGLYYLYSVFALDKVITTDDAYVNGDVVKVYSEVNGTINSVYVNNTSIVRAGDVVAVVNPQDAQVSLLKAQSALASTVRDLRAKYANVNQYDALLKQQQVALDKAKGDYNRRLPLADMNIVSKEEIEHALSALKSAQAALEVTRQQRNLALASVGGVSIDKNPAVLQAKSSFVQAWLNYQRTSIIAPVSGQVTGKNMQLGSVVSPGVALMSIVPLNNLWVDANFKETQIRKMRVGQKVLITTDMYGEDVVYHGRVVGLSPGTGSAFSLLPAQNASGNWIKIIQRVPVRISLNPRELAVHPLRIGLSANVEVKLDNREGGYLSDVVDDDTSAKSSTSVLKKDTEAANKVADEIIKQSAGSYLVHASAVKSSTTVAKQNLARGKQKLVGKHFDKKYKHT